MTRDRRVEWRVASRIVKADTAARNQERNEN